MPAQNSRSTWTRGGGALVAFGAAFFFSSAAEQQPLEQQPLEQQPLEQRARGQPLEQRARQPPGQRALQPASPPSLACDVEQAQRAQRTQLVQGLARPEPEHR